MRKEAPLLNNTPYRNAVVTGAASGLGRAVSLELARRGWSVGVVDIDEAGALETAELVEREGGTGTVFHADTGRRESARAAAQRFFAVPGGVGLLVNCAGVAAMGWAGDIPPDDWRWAVDTNLWGVVNWCEEFIPRMRSQGCGHIVNVASIAGIASMAEWAPYNVAKSAVISYSETVRVELAPAGIGVTVACPIYFDSNLARTMRCTDPWQRAYLEAALAGARMDSSAVAAKILLAVERNRLYVLPQASAKMLWLAKRMFPRAWSRMFSVLYRTGLGRPLLKGLSRMRLV